jgi:hypothetical protein
MSCESLFRPAGVIPPFFRADLPAPFRLAHRALIAAASFARVCGDIVRLWLPDAERDGAELNSEARRLSRLSICRRTESASSNFSREICMLIVMLVELDRTAAGAVL